MIRYVLETEPGEYLRHVGGDWGPDHLPTTKVEEAMRFESPSDAQRYLEESNWGAPCKTRRISIVPETVRLV